VQTCALPICHMPRVPRVPSVLLAGVLLAACGRDVDWSSPENLLMREKVTDRDGFAELDYWSLVDAPCQRVYEALVDVEHYPDFIPGVTRVQLIGPTQRWTTVRIAHGVLERQPH